MLSILGSLLFLGISNIFFQKSTKALGADTTTVWYYVFGALISAIVYSFRTNTEPFQLSELKWPLFTAISLLLSVYFFTISLQEMEVSKASTIRSMAFVVSLVILCFFGMEKLTAQKVIGIGFAIVALLMLK